MEMLPNIEMQETVRAELGEQTHYLGISEDSLFYLMEKDHTTAFLTYECCNCGHTTDRDHNPQMKQRV